MRPQAAWNHGIAEGVGIRPQEAWNHGIAEGIVMRQRRGILESPKAWNAPKAAWNPNPQSQSQIPNPKSEMLYESRLFGASDGLEPAVCPEFFEDVLDMIVDRGPADEQVFRDVARGSAARQESEDLDLAL